MFHQQPCLDCRPRSTAHRWAVAAVFLLFLLLGLVIFRDYGIGWDEGNQRAIGLLVQRYIVDGDKSLLELPHPKYHGPVVPAAFLLVEELLGIDDSRSQLLLRHAGNFLFFYVGVLFFYLLCARRFESWKIGLLGGTFLVAHPRIFAHSFYNPKDIPFLSLFVICIYSLMTLIDNKTITRAIVHAVVCAILIDIRILGVMLPFFTTVVIVLNVLVDPNKKEKLRQWLKVLVAYCVALPFFVVLFWPTLWEHPIAEVINAYVFMKDIEWPWTVLYFGEFIRGTELPWHYLPVWITITTPLLYLVLFPSGLGVMGAAFIRKPVEFIRNNQADLVGVLWFACPVAAIFFHRPVIFNGWRHLFFLYPAMVYISLVGLVGIMKAVNLRKTRMSVYFSRAIAAVVVFSVGHTAYSMYAEHPHQNVYFNLLAGDHKRANFDLDYWGLSYRAALEHILLKDEREVVRVQVQTLPGLLNSHLLSEDKRSRLYYTNKIGQSHYLGRIQYTTGSPDYFLSAFSRHHPRLLRQNETLPRFGKEWFSIEVDGEKIMAVYRRHGVSDTRP